jgi:hypothetical protein
MDGTIDIDENNNIKRNVNFAPFLRLAVQNLINLLLPKKNNTSIIVAS